MGYADVAPITLRTRFLAIGFGVFVIGPFDLITAASASWIVQCAVALEIRANAPRKLSAPIRSEAGTTLNG